MKVYIALASAVTLMMGAVALLGWRRWQLIHRGAQLIVLGVAVHFVTALISAPAAYFRVHTRVLQEGPQFVGTLLTVAGFYRWQPKPWQQRAVAIGAGVYLVLWIVAQYLQGVSAEYAAISSPLHAVFICAVAGFTLVTRVQVIADRWTRQLWFVFSIGLLVDYGTETVLSPLLATLVGSRMDLILIATYIHLAAGVIGYGIMTWGLARVGTTILVERAEPSDPAWSR